jgi:hypothetical protein
MGRKERISQKDSCSLAGRTQDGYLCMHLRLFGDGVLVTFDGETERSLKRSLALWDARVPTTAAKCRVIVMDDYRKTYAP